MVINPRSLRCLACERHMFLRAVKKRKCNATLTPQRYFSATHTRPSTSVQTPAYYPPPDTLKRPAFAHLTDRSLIRLQGADVVHFLNGLLPSRLQPLPKTSSTPTFTTFLSAKGRVLFDVFIYPPVESDADGTWFLDVDSRSAPAVFSHLKKHKLRSKFKLEKVAADELGTFYVWPGSNDSFELGQVTTGGRDPRPLMGTRFLSPVSNPSPTLAALQELGEQLSLDEYKVHRMITGHAEGPGELINGSALPQESNIDFSGGIDFHKGCYLGQELTIRTHHTGVVRKRVLPCQIYTRGQEVASDQQVPVYDSSVSLPQPPSETSISKARSTGRAGRSTGKWLGGVGNIGLALCRLENMTDVQLTAEGSNYNVNDQFNIVWEESTPGSEGESTVREVHIRPFVPQWLRQNIEAGIRARSERSKKKKQEDDEEDIDD